MADSRVMTGALALVKSGGKICGLLRGVTCTENYTRGDVKGLGTIYSSEVPVLSFDGSLSCDFMEIDFTTSGVPGAIKRQFENINSQVISGGISLEDQLVLDQEGVQIDVFKKVEDVIDPNGNIVPKLNPYVSCYNCFITSDGFTINEQQVAGHNQSFKYLKSIGGN